MDDWKLKTSPVVRLERPNERFVDSRLWVVSGCADVATGKRRIKCADAKCGCLGKRRMCGCQFFRVY